MSDQGENFIGAVVYRPGDEPGTLEADWVKSTETGDAILKGWATGGPVRGLVGDYTIVYHNERGEPSEPYDLKIVVSGEILHLRWSKKGRQIYKGIGMLRDNTIIAGWGPIQ